MHFVVAVGAGQSFAADAALAWIPAREFVVKQ